MKATLSKIITDRIVADATTLNHEWSNPKGTKTKHFIIDDLLPPDIANNIFQAFPKRDAKWSQRNSFRERKKTFAKLESVDSLIGSITDAFHANDVLHAIKNVVSIDGLEADPSLYAGGISMMSKGDFLNPHIDNSHDAQRERYRRLNLLYYISQHWQLENGGNFELWDDSVKSQKVIQSKFNRLVVMETTRFSWHSVNPVLVDADRCCISNYYFSKNSPESKHYYHVTSFLGRPDQKIIRILGMADNFSRKWVAILTKRSRGKSLARY